MRKICFALAIAAIALCAFLFQRNAPAIITWINTLGSIAPIIFLILYCLATVFLFPTMVLTLAGGAVFGPVVGTLFNLVGATLGAVCAFCISRYLVFDWLAAKKNARINSLIAGVERRGWQFVALVRLVPIIPFNLVNYGFGVTRIKFSHYLIATLIFLIPTEILFTYCGYAGMSLLSHAPAFFNKNNLILIISTAIALLAYVLLIRHRRQLSQRLLSEASKSRKLLTKG